MKGTQMTIWVTDMKCNSANAAAANNDRNAERNAVTHEPMLQQSSVHAMGNRFNSLNKRADEEMASWCKTLSRKDRSKLRVQASPWGCNGGSIIAPGLRKRRAARRHEKLKRDRGTHLRAEQSAYEARRHTCELLVKD
jgi:GH24 family phage-related lysozyme (muramidase)